MGWNENVKRILDFIPVFERDVKSVSELSSQLADSVNQCKEAIEQSRLLLEQNEALTKRVSELESKRVEAYDDTEVKASIERFNGMFDSFRRVEGESSAKAIAALSKRMGNLEGLVESIKPCDDRVIKKLIESIKPHDDSRVKRQIKELEQAISDIKPYDDSALKLSVKGLSESLANVKPYDDSQIKTDIKKAIKATSEVKPFDDSRLRADIKVIDKRVSSIKGYDDSQLKKSIKSLESSLSSIKPYDDKQVKTLISNLEKNVVKMIADHKLAVDKTSKSNVELTSKKIEQVNQSIAKLSKQIPASYDDKAINDRIKKQGDALAELAAEVSKIKQLFEV